jgi:Ca-activated chloride channel family protein
VSPAPVKERPSAGPPEAGPLLRRARAPKRALTYAGKQAAPKQFPFVRGLGAIGLTVLVLTLALIYPVVAKGRAWLDVEWRYPWLLLLFLVAPLVWWWGTFAQDARRPRMRIGTVVPLRRAPRGWRVRLRDLPGVLRAVAVMLFVLALARPVQVLSDRTSDEKGIDIVVVMDLSGSMQAVLDTSPEDLPMQVEIPKNRRLTRLDVAKIVVQDFVSRRQTDRIGVVVFGKAPYVLSPPTLDYQLLSKLVSGLSLSVIDGSKTAIGDALGTAIARMRHSDALSKVIILLTDGDSNAGRVSPEYAIELATTVGCKTYTVQIGDSAEVEVLQGYDPIFGQPQYVRRRYPTNPELLQKIAEKTGGKAFIATDARALRESFHEILDQLEKTRFEASIAHHEDLFALLLIPGVVLIGLDALLRALFMRRFP